MISIPRIHEYYSKIFINFVLSDKFKVAIWLPKAYKYNVCKYIHIKLSKYRKYLEQLSVFRYVHTELFISSPKSGKLIYQCLLSIS